MNLRTNVVKQDYCFLVRRSDGVKEYVKQNAESREAALLIIKSREEMGEFTLVKDGDLK